jgi:hypothetical protein
MAAQLPPSVSAVGNVPAGGILRQSGKMTTFFTHRFQTWGRWAIAVFLGSFLVIALLVYLLVQWTTYTFWVWQNGQSDSVTLIQDIGHGGPSAITVTFHDHTLLVIDVDNNDPQRTSVIKANEEIAIPDGSGVVNASFKNLLQPGRLDLVISIRGGLAYHSQFVTFLVNNAAEVKKNPQAPGFREPTADEMKAALSKLGS